MDGILKRLRPDARKRLQMDLEYVSDVRVTDVADVADVADATDAHAPDKVIACDDARPLKRPVHLYSTSGAWAVDGKRPKLLVEPELLPALRTKDKKLKRGRCRWVENVPTELLAEEFDWPNKALCRLRDHFNPENKFAGRVEGINQYVALSFDASGKEKINDGLSRL